MDNIQKIRIDILNNKTDTYIYTKQYDVGRIVWFTITENNEIKDISGCTVQMKIMKPTGFYILKSKTIVGNKAIFELDKHCTWEYGKIPYEISIFEEKIDTPIPDEEKGILEDVDLRIATTTGYMIVEKSVIQVDDTECPEETEMYNLILRAAESAARSASIASDAASQLSPMTMEMIDAICK